MKLKDAIPLAVEREDPVLLSKIFEYLWHKLNMNLEQQFRYVNRLTGIKREQFDMLISRCTEKSEYCRLVRRR
jgi:hypothetical protein